MADSSCLECDKPGYFSGSGLCRSCEKECLGFHCEAVQPGRCKGYDCGRLADANDHFCYSCQDELDSYYVDADAY